MGCCLAPSSGPGPTAPGSSEEEEISASVDVPNDLGNIPSKRSLDPNHGTWRPQEPVLLELLRDGSGTPSDVWMQASFETQLRRLLREHPYLGQGNSVQPHPLQYWFGRCREMSQARQFGRAQGNLRRLVSGVRDEEALATETFRRFDADQAGELDATKFKHMCAYLGWDESDEKILDLDGDGKVTPKDLVRFVGHMGGAHQFFERRRLRVSTSRKDVDHVAGIAVGAKVKAHFYTQEQKSTMWREATVCEVGVVRRGHDTAGPSTFGCRLLFKFGPGDKWAVRQVVPIHWILGEIDNPRVNTALRETGILQEQQSYWSMILPDTELLTMERLTPCQRQALRNVRERAEQRHAEALDPMRKRFKDLGYDDHALGMVLDWVQDLAPMVVHVKLDEMGRFLETDEYYRSQFETKTSNGALDDQNVTRQGWERSLFGGAYEKAKPFERCKYGALNVMNDYRGVKSAEQYGDSYLVLKDVRLRTTLTFTDSSGVNIEHLGLLDKYAHVLERYNDGELRSLVKVATAAVTSQKKLGRSTTGSPLELIRGTTHDCSKEWVTLGFPGLRQSSGRLYFEVHLAKGCVGAQVGLLSADYKTMPYVASASGVGDDELGWSCDGLNSSLWHGGAERAWEAHWPSKRQAGGEMCLTEDTVVGVALDLAERTISFCTNGKWDEAPAFTPEHISESTQLYPAMSVKGEASYCFGDFKFPAPPEFQPWPGMPSWPIRADSPFIGDSTTCSVYKEIQVHGEVHLKRNVQRLVASKKYLDRSKVQRSYNLLVSNAGGYDGTYMRMGAHEGRALYKSEMGSAIYWDPVVKLWKINGSEDFSSFVSSAPADPTGGPPRRGWDVKFEMRGVADGDCFREAMSELALKDADINALVKALAQDGGQIYRETENTTFQKEWKKLGKTTSCDSEEAWKKVVKRAQARLLEAEGFDGRCQVCETEHPYPARNHSWTKRIVMEDCGAMQMVLSPNCETFDSCAVFSVSCGGMDRKAAGPGSRVEMSTNDKVICGTVVERSEGGQTWKVRMDRRSDAAAGAAAQCNGLEVPRCPHDDCYMRFMQAHYISYGCDKCGGGGSGERWHCPLHNSDYCTNCHGPPLGTSRYSEEYYCTVVRAERRSATSVSVMYDAHGDMSEGPLADPSASRVFWDSGSGEARATMCSEVKADRDSHCGGTLVFDGVPASKALKFEFGMPGYSHVDLWAAGEAPDPATWQPSVGEQVEALRDTYWDIAQIVEVRQGKSKGDDTEVGDKEGDKEGDKKGEGGEAKEEPAAQKTTTQVLAWLTGPWQAVQKPEGGDTVTEQERKGEGVEGPSPEQKEDSVQNEGSADPRHDVYVIRWADADDDDEGFEVSADQIRQYQEIPDGKVLEDINRCKGSHWEPDCFAMFAENPKLAKVEYGNVPTRPDPTTTTKGKKKKKKSTKKSEGQQEEFTMSAVGDEIKTFGLDLSQPLTPISIKEFAAQGPAQQMGVRTGWFLDIASTITGDSCRQWAKLLGGFGGVDFTNSDKNTAMPNAANDEGEKVKLSPQEGHQHKWYCGRRLGKEAIPGSNGRCGPNNGPQCASCKRFQESFQINDEQAAVSLGTTHDAATVWYCGRKLGEDAIPGSDGTCGPNNGPQCQSCKRFQDTMDALQSPDKDKMFAKRLERLVGACFRDPKGLLDRLSEAMEGGTLRDVALVFTNSASLQELGLLPDVHVSYAEDERVGSEIRVFKNNQIGGKDVQIEEFLMDGPAHKAGVREFWNMDVGKTVYLNQEAMSRLSLDAGIVRENPNVLLALKGVTLVFTHPCPVKARQVRCSGSGEYNWKGSVLTGSSAEVEFYTDGDGAAYPERRWGVRAMFLPFDAPMPPTDKMDKIFEQYEKVTKLTQGNEKPMEIERDCWDETRLRALCELHGWEFSWMTQDGEFQRRTQEQASFDVYEGEIQQVRDVSARSAADVQTILASEVPYEGEPETTPPGEPETTPPEGSGPQPPGPAESTVPEGSAPKPPEPADAPAV